MTQHRILITYPVEPAQMERLKSIGEIVEMYAADEDDDAFHGALDGIDAVLCSASRMVNADCLAKHADRLKVISNFGVGFDRIDIDCATELGVRVCNTPGVLNDAVAELTMALILSLSRNLMDADRFVRDGHWGKREFPFANDIKGKTLGLIGFGRIGLAVAERANAFGMTVIYADLRKAEDGRWQRVELDQLLSESDFVSLHVNLSEASRGLIGRDELARMKPTAYLVNTSRGPVVDSDALREALQSGAIAGAGLDVTDPEPPAPNDPLLSLPNVVVTPHMGTATFETSALMGELAVTNLIEALAGRVPPASVNDVPLR